MRSRASWFRELLIRLRPARRRDRIEREIDEELRFHVDYQVDDNVEQGMTPRQARKAALHRFGDLDDARNRCRTIQMASLTPRAQGGPIEAVLHDLQHGARSLARRPGFTVAAVLTLALGIGANAAMFSVIETVILAPLPFVAPDRVVQIWDAPATDNRPQNVSRDNFRDYDNLNDVFSYVAAIAVIGGTGVVEEREGRFETLRGYHASADLFDMMAVVPTAGRTFRAEEDAEGVGRIVLLTHAYWLRRFGGEEVIGETIHLRRQVTLPEGGNGRPELEYEIIGVLPPGFRSPPLRMGFGYGSPIGQLDPKRWAEPDVILPLGLNGWRDNQRILKILGQLRDGVTPAQARANLQSIAAGIAESEQEQEGLDVTVVPVVETLHQEYGVALSFLWAATALVLLVACASVSSLLLGWGVARERELALRAALGAGARRIFSQLLTEAMVLAAAAGALGVLLAYWGIAAVKLLAPAGVHRLDEISLDPDVLGFTLGVSLATMMLVGLWPALRGARRRSSEVLKAGGRGSTLARTRSLRALVTAEVALSLVLLAGAGLMLQSFWNLVAVDTGVASESLVYVNIRTREARGQYRGEATVEWYLRMRDRVEAIPGVISFASGGVGITGYSRTTRLQNVITLADRTRPEAGEHSLVANYRVVPGFFRTLGIPLVAGRTWDERWWRAQSTSAQGPNYVVINEEIARTFWPGESPVGKIFYGGDRDPEVANQTLDAWRRQQPGDQRPDGTRPFEVIGVVGDASMAVGREPQPTIYLATTGAFNWNHYVRTAVDPAGLMAVLRREINAIDPSELQVATIETVEQVFARESADSRFRALLVMFFGAVAMGITCLGLFGVLTHAVAQRTRELGIRVALGAGNSQIAGLVLSQGARMVGLGVALGLVLVFSMTRYISSLLFGIVPLDPTTLFGVAGLIFALALLASYLPARRAMRVDPIEALRH